MFKAPWMNTNGQWVILFGENNGTNLEQIRNKSVCAISHIHPHTSGQETILFHEQFANSKCLEDVDVVGYSHWNGPQRGRSTMFNHKCQTKMTFCPSWLAEENTQQMISFIGTAVAFLILDLTGCFFFLHQSLASLDADKGWYMLLYQSTCASTFTVHLHSISSLIMLILDQDVGTVGTVGMKRVVGSWAHWASYWSRHALGSVKLIAR